MAIFILNSDSLSEPALNTLRKTISTAKHAHYTDIDMRINGENQRFQADWVKYLIEQQPKAERGQRD